MLCKLMFVKRYKYFGVRSVTVETAYSSRAPQKSCGVSKGHVPFVGIVHVVGIGEASFRGKPTTSRRINPGRRLHKHACPDPDLDKTP